MKSIATFFVIEKIERELSSGSLDDVMTFEFQTLMLKRCVVVFVVKVMRWENFQSSARISDNRKVNGSTKIPEKPHKRPLRG